MHGFLVTYEGLNVLCEGRAVVIAETPEQAEKLVKEAPESSECFEQDPDRPIDSSEIDITKPGVIYNDPGL